MAHPLAGWTLTIIVKNSFQFKRTYLPVECEKVFLHSLQKKADQIKYNIEGTDQGRKIFNWYQTVA